MYMYVYCKYIYVCVCVDIYIYIYAVILQMLVVFTMLFFVDKCTVVQRVTREIQKEYITKMQFLIEKSCSNASQKWDLKLGLTQSLVQRISTDGSDVTQTGHINLASLQTTITW